MFKSPKKQPELVDARGNDLRQGVIIGGGQIKIVPQMLALDIGEWSVITHACSTISQDDLSKTQVSRVRLDAPKQSYTRSDSRSECNA